MNYVDVKLKSDRDISLLAKDKMEIDIAIDLKPFCLYCRPNIFAKGSAPIQVGFNRVSRHDGGRILIETPLIADQHIWIPDSTSKIFLRKNCLHAL